MAADVKTHLYEWSTTEGSNLPVGSTVVSTNLDDNLRMIQKVVRDLSAPTTLAADTSTDLGSKDETFITLTGSAATITGLGTVSAGIYKWVVFNAAHVLTHSATDLILPSGANITAASGDVACFVSLGTGKWRCLSYTRASGNNVLNASTFGDGTVGAPSITFAADLDTGFYRSGTNTVNVAAGGASRLQVSTSVTVQAPLTVNPAGGAVTIAPAAAATPGQVAITGGTSSSATAAGDVTITGGEGTSTGAGGDVVLAPGEAASGSYGDVELWGRGACTLRVKGASNHLEIVGQGDSNPVIASGGGTSPTIEGYDHAFKITLGSSPGTTDIVVTFGRSFANAWSWHPVVIAQYQSDHILLRAVATATNVTITPASAMTAGHVIDVWVIGRTQT